MAESRSIQIVSAQPFDIIIGAPLRAAIQAQELAAKTTVEFINSVGFKEEVDESEEDEFSIEAEVRDIEKERELRNLTFTYSRADESGEDKCTLKVPLLTVVPIPYLRIEEMTIDYSISINEQETSIQKQKAQLEKTSTASRSGYSRYRSWWRYRRYGWHGYRGTYSRKHESSSARRTRFESTTTMNVNVRAVQDDLPAGLTKVLSILEDLITESREPVETANQ